MITRRFECVQSTRAPAGVWVASATALLTVITVPIAPCAQPFWAR